MRFQGIPEGTHPTESELEDLTGTDPRAWAISYGVTDAVTTLQDMIKGKYICLPEGGANINQTMQIVVK